MPIANLLIFSLLIVSHLFALDAGRRNKKFSEWQEQGIKTDVVIVSEDNQKINCHSLILLSYSDYWEKMLSGNFIESSSKTINLNYKNETIYNIIKNIYLLDNYTTKNITSADILQEMWGYGHMVQDRILQKKLSDHPLFPSFVYNFIELFEHAIDVNNKAMIKNNFIEYVQNYYESDDVFNINILILNNLNNPNIKNLLQGWMFPRFFADLKTINPNLIDEHFFPKSNIDNIKFMDLMPKEELEELLKEAENISMILRLKGFEQAINLAQSLTIDSPKKFIALLWAKNLLSDNHYDRYGTVSNATNSLSRNISYDVKIYQDTFTGDKYKKYVIFNSLLSNKISDRLRSEIESLVLDNIVLLNMHNVKVNMEVRKKINNTNKNSDPTRPLAELFEISKNNNRLSEKLELYYYKIMTLFDRYNEDMEAYINEAFIQISDIISNDNIACDKIYLKNNILFANPFIFIREIMQIYHQNQKQSL